MPTSSLMLTVDPEFMSRSMPDPVVCASVLDNRQPHTPMLLYDYVFRVGRGNLTGTIVRQSVFLTRSAAVPFPELKHWSIIFDRPF